METNLLKAFEDQTMVPQWHVFHHTQGRNLGKTCYSGGPHTKCL